jgi:pyrroline-5-carboxylate reductase
MRVILLGYGNMGAALAEGMLKNQVVSKKELAVIEQHQPRVDIARDLGLSVYSSARELPSVSLEDTILICAVKPQQAAEALSSLDDKVGGIAAVVSIMAGVSCKAVSQMLGQNSEQANTRVARVMPNLPACFGKGMSGIYFESSWEEQQRARVRAIFEAVGRVLEVESEADIDKVTAISGSGPAYFYLLTEALVEAAQSLGFSAEDARALAEQTFLGAAEHLARSGLSAPTLKQMVTSPGGTTEAALTAFESGGFAKLIADGVREAAKRAAELGA